MSTNRLRIVVFGYIVRGPLGGLTWHHLQYVMGLAKLGHDVYFLEDSNDYASCYDPTTHTMGTNYIYGGRYAFQCFERVGLKERWAYFDAHTAEWVGPAASRTVELAETAELLINVSGVNPLRPSFMEVTNRVFIDTDPAFTQIKHLTKPDARALASAHTVFFSFGENIERGTAKLPDDGFPWKATRQPIVIDAWPLVQPPPDAPFTTIMQWDSYPALEYQGQVFGMKSHSFRSYPDFPKKVEIPLELALGSGPKLELVNEGWRIVDSIGITRDPWTYQAYIQASRGEFAIAKAGYVEGQSGWFSERSAAYLASGRPVVVQDTGFRTWLEADVGVLSFQNAEDAAEKLREISRDYARHAKEARRVADAYFASDYVLGDLIEKAFSTASSGNSGLQ